MFHSVSGPRATAVVRLVYFSSVVSFFSRLSWTLAVVYHTGRLLLEQKATLLGSFLLLAAVIAFSGRITMNSGAPRTSFSERTFRMKNDGNDDELHEAYLKWKDFLYRIRQGFNLQMDQFKGYLFNHWKESDDVLQEHHGK